MALPNIILLNGYILLKDVESSVGISTSDSTYLIGNVEMVNASTITTALNDKLFFNPVYAEKIQEGGITYFLVKENTIPFKEGIPL
jgi:hypothetical protein